MATYQLKKDQVHVDGTIRKAMTPDMEKKALHEAVQELKGKKKKHPWKKAMKNRNEEVKKEQHEIAKEFEGMNDPEAKKIAATIKKHADSLPEPTTKHDQYVSALKEKVKDNRHEQLNDKER